MYKKYMKRVVDILCALAAIIVFSWLYIIVAILVRVKLGSPVLFKQKRPGLNGKIFTLYKFRTMTDARDEDGNLLPDDVREAIKEAEDATKDYHDRLFNLAIGYDGRLEIVDAVKKIYQKIEAGELSIDDVDEKLINDNLYTEGLADPNLIIRTSGEERLSGFLLWQSSYSELYFCDSLWPELRKIDYLRAIRDYQARDRRFGV